MPRNPWFETVAEAQRRAKRRLPKSVYSALLAGSEASGNRHAERFARQVLAGADATLLAAARQAVDP